MMEKRLIAAVAGLGLLGAVLLGVLATVGHASAAPAPQAQTPTTGAVAWASGQITALQQNGFTIQSRSQQTTTVTVDANTWIVVDKNNTPTQGALAELKVGDNVSVGGVASGTNAIAARVVQAGGAGPFFGGPGGGRGERDGFGGPGARDGKGLQGTIQAIANGTLSVTLTHGDNTSTLTVNTDASTVVIKNGPAAVADLKTGDTVQITPQFMTRQPGAAPAATSAITAAVVYVPGANDTLFAGHVQSVSGSTLTLGGPHNSSGTQVNVDATTTYKRLGAAGTAPAGAALSDIQAGTEVLLYGAKPAAGQTATASVVLILPTPQKPEQPTAPAGGGL